MSTLKVVSEWIFPKQNLTSAQQHTITRRGLNLIIVAVRSEDERNIRINTVQYFCLAMA